ncbi:MAG TPA: hypothetical protein VK524_09055 [Polyangiaceae bacterium]|nr:hypothetical protein [Polyangiaceae bacterium]
MNQRAWLFSKFIALVLSLLFVACKPEIGDECEVSTDCSATGDRLCDTTQPDGYCTMFNCEPNSCPEEAVCIGYGNVLSTVPECSDPQAGRRLQRTFCLKSCESDDDCRGGYECIDMKRENDWGAVVVERSGKSGKVCAVPFSGMKPEPPADPAVCTGGFRGDAGPPPIPDAGDAAPDSGSDAADAGDTADAGSDASDASDDAAATGDAAADALVE